MLSERPCARNCLVVESLAAYEQVAGPEIKIMAGGGLKAVKDIIKQLS